MAIEKTKIAEVLFDNPDRITSEMIIHILSHLPDDNKKGEFSQIANVKFDHDSKDPFESCGLNFEDMLKIDEVISGLVDGPTKKRKVSQVIEEIFTQAEDPKFRLKLSAYCAFQISQAYKKGKSKGFSGKSPQDLDDLLKGAIIISDKGDPKKMLREINILRGILDRLENVIRGKM